MSESKQQWTPGPWEWVGRDLESNYPGHYAAVIETGVSCGAHCYGGSVDLKISEADAKLIAAAPELVEVARESRAAMVAYLEDHSHIAPEHCYATGPKTGNEFHDLVRCPGCCAQDAFTGLISKIDAALAKAGA